MDHIWVEDDKDINEIINNEMKIHIKWSKNPSVDYLELSRHYMNAGYVILKEIIEVQHNDNVKYDMWFLPGVYMMRQAIELLLKAGLAEREEKKSNLQTIFLACKHDVNALYKTYKCLDGISKINQDKLEWLETYLESIEIVDSSSDLFRYPFRDEFMKQYGNKALDVWHMGNRLIDCYNILNEMIYGEEYEENVKCKEGGLEYKEEPKFIEVASSGINNCYLWESPLSDGFHKQVVGYSEVATFLYGKFEKSKEETLFYPIVFLLRNAIEIGLKRLLHMNMEECVDKHIIRGKRNSHKLYKDLWKTIKPMLIHYSEEDNQDKHTLEIVENYIKSLEGIDLSGDIFRYPSSFSHEYKFNDKEVDVENFFKYLLGLFNFIDSCDLWLSYIRDVEVELRSEW
jgi:hypothetical protein